MATATETLPRDAAGHPPAWRRPLERLVLVAAVLAMTSGPVFRSRVEWIGPVDDFNRDPLIQAVFALALGGLALVSLPSWRSLRATDDDGRLAYAQLALPAVLVVSTIWSIHREWTLFQSTMFALGVVAFLLAGAHFSPRELLACTWAAMQIGVVLSVLAWQLEWRYAVEVRGWVVGIYFNRNFLGLVTVIGMLTSVALLLDEARRASRRAHVLVLVAAAFVLDAWVWRRTDSLTPALALVGAMLVTALVVLATRPGPTLHLRRLAAVTVAGLTTGALIYATAFSDLLSDAVGRSSTFTGRTTIWSELLPRIGERPIQGWGLMAVWYDPELRADLIAARRDVFKAHSGYLEIAAAAGIIGLAVLLGILVVVGIAIVRRVSRRSDAIAWWFVAVGAFAVLVNLGETYIGHTWLPWFLLVAITPQLLRPEET